MKKNKEKTNPIIWIVGAILIPLLVAIILAFILFTMSGFDTLSWLKKVGSKTPVIASLISPDESETAKDKQAASNDKSIEASTKRKDDLIEKLKQENHDLQAHIKELEQGHVKLEKKLETLQKKEGTDENKTTEVASFVGSFKEMDPEKAGKIIGNMEQSTAISILNEMPNKIRGAILEEMDPKQAASLAQELLGDT